MGYEIAFIAAGEKSRGGDAIALRWGDLYNNHQHVVVIDGGFADTGEALVNFIKKRFGDPKEIDLMISTHPHADHIGGLEIVLDKFTVKELWMHLPWRHDAGIKSACENGKMPPIIGAAWDLHTKAKRKNVSVTEPFFSPIPTCFSGDFGGKIKVLGPSESYYKNLLKCFFDSPQLADGRKAVSEESWDEDSVDDSGEDTAENNSSVILEFSYEGKNFLFTADAGIPALKEACKVRNREPLQLVQIPHHGSTHNIGPTVLNCLVGPIVRKENWSPTTTAVVSCAPEWDGKHPSNRVLNMFTRRNCKCYKTAGVDHIHLENSPNQYNDAKCLPFYEKVNDEGE